MRMIQSIKNTWNSHPEKFLINHGLTNNIDKKISQKTSAKKKIKTETLYISLGDTQEQALRNLSMLPHYQTLEIPSSQQHNDKTSFELPTDQATLYTMQYDLAHPELHNELSLFAYHARRGEIETGRKKETPVEEGTFFDKKAKYKTAHQTPQHKKMLDFDIKTLKELGVQADISKPYALRWGNTESSKERGHYILDIKNEKNCDIGDVSKNPEYMIAQLLTIMQQKAEEGKALPHFEEDNKKIIGTHDEWKNFNQYFVENHIELAKEISDNKYTHFEDIIAEQQYQKKLLSMENIIDDMDVPQNTLINNPKEVSDNIQNSLIKIKNDLLENPDLLEYFTKLGNKKETLQKFSDIHQHIEMFISLLNKIEQKENPSEYLGKLIDKFQPLIQVCDDLLSVVDGIVSKNKTLSASRETQEHPKKSKVANALKHLPLIGWIPAHYIKFSPSPLLGVHIISKNDKKAFVSDRHDEFRNILKDFGDNIIKKDKKIINRNSIARKISLLREDLGLVHGLAHIPHFFRKHSTATKTVAMGMTAASIAAYGASFSDAGASLLGVKALHTVGLPAATGAGLIADNGPIDSLHHVAMAIVGSMLGLGLATILGRKTVDNMTHAVSHKLHEWSENNHQRVKNAQKYSITGMLAIRAKEKHHHTDADEDAHGHSHSHSHSHSHHHGHGHSHGIGEPEGLDDILKKHLPKGMEKDSTLYQEILFTVDEILNETNEKEVQTPHNKSGGFKKIKDTILDNGILGGTLKAGRKLFAKSHNKKNHHGDNAKHHHDSLEDKLDEVTKGLQSFIPDILEDTEEKWYKAQELKKMKDFLRSPKSNFRKFLEKTCVKSPKKQFTLAEIQQILGNKAEALDTVIQDTHNARQARLPLYQTIIGGMLAKQMDIDLKTIHKDVPAKMPPASHEIQETDTSLKNILAHIREQSPQEKLNPLNMSADGIEEYKTNKINSIKQAIQTIADSGMIKEEEKTHLGHTQPSAIKQSLSLLQDYVSLLKHDKDIQPAEINLMDKFFGDDIANIREFLHHIDTNKNKSGRHKMSDTTKAFVNSFINVVRKPTETGKWETFGYDLSKNASSPLNRVWRNVEHIAEHIPIKPMIAIAAAYIALEQKGIGPENIEGLGKVFEFGEKIYGFITNGNDIATSLILAEQAIDIIVHSLELIATTAAVAGGKDNPLAGEIKGFVKNTTNSLLDNLSLGYHSKKHDENLIKKDIKSFQPKIN